jgi:hypothetical protein
LIIKPGGKGIEYMHGDDFTFISWDSISGAVEKVNYFSFEAKAKLWR